MHSDKGTEVSEQYVGPAMNGDLHTRLREATKALHHDIDHHPLLVPLVGGDLQRVQYGHALVALHGIYAALEEAVSDTAVNAGFDYVERRKLPAIEADLRELGLDVRPCKIVVSPPSDIAALIGMLYPIEGSTLGAQVICRHLAKKSPGILPLRHFTGYGEATWTRWQLFWDFAKRVCPAEAADDACSAAVLTFLAIKQHLDDVHNELVATRPSLEFKTGFNEKQPMDRAEGVHRSGFNRRL
ncbi:MAG: biliverdin-producing heme oxygenase [Actinomycetota bacterium]